MSLPPTVICTDYSITSLSGSSQQLMAQSMTRSFLCIVNTGSSNIGVNIAGGTAAIGGTGTITIVPNGSLILDTVVVGNLINVIGTSGQPVCAIASP